MFNWINSNLDVVFFLYGLAFVVMGLSIFFQPRKGSDFRIGSILWLLAGFGIIHGVNEWLDMWAIIKGRGQFTDTDRKSTRLNSSHGYISHAVFCFKKRKIPARFAREGNATLRRNARRITRGPP